MLFTTWPKVGFYPRTGLFSNVFILINCTEEEGSEKEHRKETKGAGPQQTELNSPETEAQVQVFLKTDQILCSMIWSIVCAPHRGSV